MNQKVLSIFIIGLLIFLCGCVNTREIKDTLEQQQRTIDDLDSRNAKMEGKIQSLEETLEAIKQEMATLKENVKKTSPAYLEGSLQEGN